MSDEVHRSIGRATSGFVESPAGCGKTEAIVKTIHSHCDGPQLVLTHTHAGVDALRQRFRKYEVPASKYHVDTIAGWAWGWVRKYRENANYRGPIDVAEWNQVYASMPNLLQKDFARRGIGNSYAGVIVDEYQDCTIPMHELVVAIKRILPCRVLGDDLQGIFGFRDDPLIGWSDVKAEFANDLGVLEIPHRWIAANNEPLGRWLLGTRPNFRRNLEPEYRGAPIDRRKVSYRDLSPHLVRLTYEKEGRICVIGPKTRRLPVGIESALVNHGYRVLEPNELSALRKLILALSDGAPSRKSDAAIGFLFNAHGGLSAADKAFIGKVLKGQAQRPRRIDRRKLCEEHGEGMTMHLLLALIKYIEVVDGVSCKLKESVSALKCILEIHLETGTDLKSLYVDEIARRKYQSRSSIYRCIGSTLLVKGLEFDHTVILRSPDWQHSWGNHRDLYVAMTRGTKTTTLIELTD